MEKKHPSSIQIIEKAIKLIWHEETPTELSIQPDGAALKDFYKKNKRILAGPVTSVIREIYDFSNPEVDIPIHIQKLFMEAEGILLEAATRKAEREDGLMRQFRERNREIIR